LKKISIVTKMELKKELLNLLKEKKLKIFVINYYPLKERREYLNKRFKDLGIQNKVEWIIQRPGDYKKEIKKFSPLKKIWESANRHMDGPKFFKLNEADINLIENHLKAYKKIIKRNLENVLILEDDVIISREFILRLKKCLDNLPDEYDIAYTDFGIGLRFTKRVSKLKFLRYNGPLTRTTASYFISKNGAKKFLNNVRPILPIDWNMRYFERILQMKVYWLRGFLTYQGSIYGGHYKTSLQARMNPTKIQKIILKIESKRFDQKLIWKVILLIYDVLFIIPYRLVRVMFKKIR